MAAERWSKVFIPIVNNRGSASGNVMYSLTHQRSSLADSFQCRQRLQYTEVSDTGAFEFSDLPHMSVNNLTTQTTQTTDICHLQ